MITNRKLLGWVAILSTAVLAMVLSVGPISHGPNPFPPDDNGGNIVAHGPNPFPPDDNGGNIWHGPNPFPPDDNGGNIVG